MIEIAFCLHGAMTLTQSAGEGMKRGGTSGLEPFYITQPEAKRAKIKKAREILEFMF